MPVQKASLYEHLFPLTTIMKQRIVERFDGDALDERWQTRDIIGTATFAMVDAIDEGFEIITSAGIDHNSQIDFNNIRQYSNIASVIIIVGRRVTATDTDYTIGFYDDAPDASTTSRSRMRDFSGSTFKGLNTHDGTTDSQTNSSVAVDTIFRTYKIEMRSADNRLFIDGILEVTKTTNLPTQKLQPQFHMQSKAVATSTGRIRYLEAFNT